MWGLFVGAAAAVLAPIGPGALVPLKLAIASADSVGNDVYVAVVVDFGNGSRSTVSKCVPMASNARDSDALAAAVGSSNVAYASSGLLCAIDNYPVNGVQNCGQSDGNGDYDYWSYWHGSSGSWAYADNGPTEQSVSSPADDVEGLKFQLDQPDNSSNPPPDVPPSYSQICNASTEVPPAQGPAAPPTATTVAPAPTASATPTTTETGTGVAPAPTTSTAVSTRSKASGATTTTTPRQTTTTLASADADGSEGANHGSSSAPRSISASPTSHESSGGGSSDNLLPVIVIVIVVAALGGFATLRWRRRPAEE
jgi:hypothetical protein